MLDAAPRNHPGLAVSLSPVISLLLFLALFAGFQGGRYFMANRLQEVGIAAALLVFVLGAWVTLFKLDQSIWKRWVYTPCLLLGGIMFLWGTVYGIRFGESVLFSVFASREFLLGFIGPAMFLVVRAGYPISSLRRVIWFTLLALLLNYLFFYMTMDLRAAFFSSDHTISNLVTYDEWRGFRLKPSMFAVMLALLAGFMLLFQNTTLLAKLFALSLIALAIYIWTIVQFRANLATMLLGVFVYVLFLAKPSRIPWILLLIPLVVIITPKVSLLVLEHFRGADGGSLRLNSYALALSNIPNYFFLGVGEDNAYGKTYQDLFGRTFYPSDLGLIGICLKYGVLGTLLYLAAHFTICVRLWRANFQFREHYGSHDPLLWGMLILMTAQTINLPLIPGLAYAQGITLGSMALALCGLMSSAEISPSRGSLPVLQTAGR